jgi:hypothetical protein
VFGLSDRDLPLVLWKSSIHSEQRSSTSSRKRLQKQLALPTTYSTSSERESKIKVQATTKTQVSRLVLSFTQIAAQVAVALALQSASRELDRVLYTLRLADIGLPRNVSQYLDLESERG